MSRNEVSNPDTGAPPARSRNPAEIERDIAAVRARMDRTLDEIEYRLSPGQISASISRTVQDVLQGNPNPLGDAIRRHPVPAALIGIGAVWLGIAMLRDRQAAPQPGATVPVSLSGEEAEGVLTPLVGLARQAADAFRQAEAVLMGDDLRGLAAECALQYDRTAVALEEEVRRLGGTPGGGVMPPSHPHPAWSELRRAVTTQDREAVIAGMERGADATFEEFRNALHEPLPEQTRVVVGAHFHAVEQMHNRIGALRNAVG